MTTHFTPKCSTDVFTSDELALLTLHGPRWHELADGTADPVSEGDRRVVNLIRYVRSETDGASRPAPASAEERVCHKYFARVQYEDDRSSTPHFKLTEPGEDWYSREDCERGIHYPNEGGRIYSNKQRHR